jgi:hypothetical protein
LSQNCPHHFSDSLNWWRDLHQVSFPSAFWKHAFVVFSIALEKMKLHLLFFSVWPQFFLGELLRLLLFKIFSFWNFLIMCLTTRVLLV